MTADARSLVVFPQHGGGSGAELGGPLRACVERYLGRLGSILFRGFQIEGSDAFRRFAAGFGQPLCCEPERPRFEERASAGLQRRAAARGGWPARLWFHAAASGGGLRLADGREVFRNLPGKLRARFIDRGLQYVSEFEREAQLPGAAGEAQRAAFAEHCRARGVACERRADGGLQMRQLVPVVIAHPVTAELIWFNRAHSFHQSRVRYGTSRGEALLRTGGLSRQRVSYADGRAIEPGALEELCAVFEQVEQQHSWEAGDVLLLDNLSLSHAELLEANREARGVAMTLQTEACFQLPAADARGLGPERQLPRPLGGANSSQRSVSRPSRSWA